MQLSLEQLKSLFPPGSYLDRRKANLVTVCPQCGHNEFGISLSENHRFGCYRKKKCGFTGNIFSLLKFLGRADMYVTAGKVDYDQIELKLKQVEEEYELQLELPTQRPPVGWKRIYSHPYLDARGFDQYERYEVGIADVHPKLKGFVVFLIKENDVVKGYISRNTKSKEEIERYNKEYQEKYGIKNKMKRYINSDTEFGKLAFGFDEIVPGKTKTLIIVEGIFDKFNIDKLLDLHNQDEIKCNGTFKGGCSPEQIYKWLYVGIEDVILLYDPDILSDIKKTAFELDEYFNVKVGFNDKGNDPGDMTLEELEVVFDNLKSPESFAVDKIQLKNWDF